MIESDFRLEIPVEVAGAFRALAKLGDLGIRRFVEAMEKTGPFLGKPEKRAHLIAPYVDQLGTESTCLEVLRDIVVPMHDTRERFGVSPDQMHKAVGASLNRSKDWPADVLQFWDSNRDPLLVLLGSSILELEAKASALMRARPDRVTKMRMLSDLRPVYDAEARTIRAHVLMNTLQVTFLQDGSQKMACFALRPDQLQSLAEQVERTQRKNGLLAKVGSESAPVLGLVPELETQDEGEQ